MKTLSVGGVPEHFNLPWKALEEEERRGWQDGGGGGRDRARSPVRFVEVREGSGAMLRRLGDGELDGVVALTECVVAEAVTRKSTGGDGVEIVGTFVESQLVWGIHVAGNSTVETVEELRGKRFGISRRGSGSHVMAAVMAKQRGWKEGLEFVVIGGFRELRDATNRGDCDVFIWEKFMTRPFHASGEVRTIGELPTPWSSFVLAKRRGSEKTAGGALRSALQAALRCAQPFKANVDDQSVHQIVDRFGLSAPDAREWLDAVRYADPEQPTSAALHDDLRNAFDALLHAQVIPPDAAFDLKSLLVAAEPLPSPQKADN